MEFKRIKELMVDGAESVESPPPEPKKRGRQLGSKSKVTKANATEALANGLVSMHALLSHITGIEELELSDPEGKIVAESFEQVAEAYDFTPSPQTAATVNLIAVMVSVYGLRIHAYRKRKIAELEEIEARAKQLEETEKLASNVAYLQPELNLGTRHGS